MLQLPPGDDRVRGEPGSYGSTGFSGVPASSRSTESAGKMVSPIRTYSAGKLVSPRETESAGKLARFTWILLPVSGIFGLETTVQARHE